MKKTICLLLALFLIMLYGNVSAGRVLLPEEVITNQWFQDEHARLKVGNTTPLTGRFFTSMWGGTTSDLDVQDLLHAYSPILWDGELGRFRFDRSVVEDAIITTDQEGNRDYLLVLEEGLVWSDGTPITARDYAFSVLLQVDPAVAETGGDPVDFSWLAGCDEYLSGEAKTISGLRIIADNMLQITMKAESLPYFYVLNRLSIRPYPAAEIAPGTKVKDDGEGAYLTKPLTADLLREYVLDESIGYLSHPRVASGPYVLESFDGTTAVFAINPLYIGNEEGMHPRIGEIEYTTADNETMVSQLTDGRLDLLNKVTMSDSIQQGIRLVRSGYDSYAMDNEMRTGLTMIWFLETSPKVQEAAIRKAVAYCFDRDSFTQEYNGQFGLRTDGFYGLGQWMYRTAAGLTEPPVFLPEKATEEEKATYEASLKAWKDISLNGLTRYEYNPDEAVRLLEEAGWNLNEDGEPFDETKDRTRYRKDGEELTALTLTLAMPESDKAWSAMEKHLATRLRLAGVMLRVKTIDMETLVDAYKGKTDIEADMIYLGENFRIAFDPEIFAPHTEGTELGAIRKELFSLAQDMVHTRQEDLLSFEQKWVKLQERITETLSLIPVYSNVYFDFFNRRLHNYQITQSPTWGEAIVSAYMSDKEEINEEELQRIQEQLAETEGLEDPLPRSE